MLVHLLSPYRGDVIASIRNTILDAGDELLHSEDEKPDFMVLFGHRRILKNPPCPAINIHISYLPWNRGASPNLWSWYDNTPKGVTIHEVTDKVDAGPILARHQVIFTVDGETLTTTYDRLQQTAAKLFRRFWPAIRDRKLIAHIENGGSYHTVADSERLLKRLPLGYDTPVSEVVKMGKEARLAQAG